MSRRVTVAMLLSSVALSTSAYAQQWDSIQNSHACSGANPAPNEVYVYTGVQYGGTCRALYGGLYPTPANLGVPNDSIVSIKVGQDVNVILFQDNEYGFGNALLISVHAGGTQVPCCFSGISSARVGDNNRSPNCSDLRPGEFAVFRDAAFQSDCMVLYYGHSYPTVATMGIANDSISSIDAGPTFVPSSSSCNPTPWLVYLYKNANYGNPNYSIFSGNTNTNLTANGFNDITSSIFTTYACIP